uniref:Uncharacterized protein n=1 Tax=viral metagenome TaxID=1070528 RepID=A0A6C0EN11_9ZZZZ
MKDLPYLEDVYKLHFTNIKNTLFSNESNNKVRVYILSIIHIIGTLVLQWGIFLKPDYLYYYFIYLFLIFISYYIFDNRCFMTLISNKYSGLVGSPLYIKKNTAKNIIIINSIIAIIGILTPNMAPYTILKTIFN